MAAFIDREAEVADTSSDDDEDDDDERKGSKRKHRKEKAANKKVKTETGKAGGGKKDAEGSLSDDDSSSDSSSGSSSGSSSSSDSDSEIENSEDEPPDNEEQLRKEMAGFVVENEDEEEGEDVAGGAAKTTQDVEEEEEEDEEETPQKAPVEDELEEDDYELINENLGVKNKPRRIRIEDDSDEEGQIGGANDNRADNDDEAQSPSDTATNADRTGKKVSRHDSSTSGGRDAARNGDAGDDTNDDEESGGDDEADFDDFIVDDQNNPMKLKIGGKGMTGWQYQSLQEAQEIFGLDFDVEDLDTWTDGDVRGADGDADGIDEFDDQYEYDEDDDGTPIPRHRRKARKDLSQLYEAAELERNYLTPRDEKIRNEDIPERFLTRRVPVVPLIKSDDETSPASVLTAEDINAAKDAEAEWIYDTIYRQALQPLLSHSADSREVRQIFRFAGEREKLLKMIKSVVGFIREDRVEVPFISAYRKELIIGLNDEDLWYIYDLDEQYTALSQRREMMQKSMQTMQQFLNAESKLAESPQTRNDENVLASRLPPITDDMLDAVGCVQTIEQLQDYKRYFKTYYGDYGNAARMFKINQRNAVATQPMPNADETTTAVDNAAVLEAPPPPVAALPASENLPASAPSDVLNDPRDDKSATVLLKAKRENIDAAGAAEPMEGVAESAAEPDVALSQLVISDASDAAGAVAVDGLSSTAATTTTVTLTAPASPASPGATASTALAPSSAANTTSPSRNRRRAVIDEDDDTAADNNDANDSKSAATTVVVKSEKIIKKEKQPRTADDEYDEDADDDDYTPDGNDDPTKKLAKNAAALRLTDDDAATSVPTPAPSQIATQHHHLPTRRESYLQTFMRQRIDEFVTRHFGVDLQQFAVGVAGGQARNVLRHQEYADPDEVAAKYTGTHYQSIKQVKKAGVMLLALRMANFPQVRAAIRERFFKFAKISVRPTTHGIRDIDEQHSCYRVKYLTNKPLSRLLPQDFAAIHAAAQTGLLCYKLSLDNVESMSGDPKMPPKMVMADNRQLRTLTGVGGINTHSMPSSANPAGAAGNSAGGTRDGMQQHAKQQHHSASTPFIVAIKDYLLKDEYREEVQNWNKLRVLALQVALYDHVYPMLEKELESRLLREANDMILRKIYAEVDHVVMMKPFRPVLTTNSSSGGGGGGGSMTKKSQHTHSSKKINASDLHVDLDARSIMDDQEATHATIATETDVDMAEEISGEWALGENDRNLRVMGISWDKTVNESGGAYAVVVNRWGEVLNQVALRRFLISTDWRDRQFKQEDLSELDRLVHESKPQCVAIMGGGLECERLQDDLKDMIKSMKETNSIIPLAVENVVIVDPGAAQKFQTSLEWKRRFKNPSPMFLSALGVARRLLDPITAFAQLYTFEEDLLNVPFHPMQKQMPHDELRDAILRPIIGAVNSCGVDFNEVIDHQETLMPLVQFVCGLGPRRGPHIIKTIMRNAKSGHINNREQLRAGNTNSIGNATEIVFRNMAGFVRFTRGSHEHEQGDEVNDYWYALDKTRIHPDNDPWVTKIAGDALDREDDEGTDKKQLLDEVMLPENADALQQLDLESFAEYLQGEYGDQKITLFDIRNELVAPFADKRSKYEPLTGKALFSVVVGEPAELYEQGRLAKVSVVGRNPISYRRPKPLTSKNGDETSRDDLGALPYEYRPERNENDSKYHCKLCRRVLGESAGEAARHVLSAFTANNNSKANNFGQNNAPINPDDCPGEALWVSARFDSGIFARIYADCLSSSSNADRPIDTIIKPNQVLMARIMRTEFHERLRGCSSVLTTRSKDLRGPMLRICSEIEFRLAKKFMDRPEVDEILNPVLNNRDAEYDMNAEQLDFNKHKEKYALARQAAQARKLTNRVITHPNFKNIDYAQCEKLMESMDAGECVFRPSSQGYSHLTVSFKLLPKVVMHINIKEERKENAFSLGKRLIIDVGGGSAGPRYEEFEDLDEIKARFVDVICSNVREVTSNRYFFFKPKPPSTATEDEAAATNAAPPCYADLERIRRYLTEEKDRQPQRIPYCMSPSLEHPGRFMLAYMPRRDKPPSIEWFKVAFDGFIYRQKTLPSLASMLAYFKDHFHEPPPRTATSQNTSQSAYSSHQHHNEALAGAFSSGLMQQLFAGATTGTPAFDAAALLRTPNLMRTPGAGQPSGLNAAGGVARIGGAAAPGGAVPGTMLSSDVISTLSKLTPLAAASFQNAAGPVGASPAGGNARMTPSLLGSAPSNNPMVSPYAAGGAGVRCSGGTPQSTAGSYAHSMAVGGAGNAWNQAFQYFERAAEGGGGAGHGDYGERRTPRERGNTPREYSSGGSGRQHQPSYYDEPRRHSSTQPQQQASHRSSTNDYSASQGTMMPPPPPGLPGPAVPRDPVHHKSSSNNMMPPPVPPYHGSSSGRDRRRY